jgi:hypothetical protein
VLFRSVTKKLSNVALQTSGNAAADALLFTTAGGTFVLTSVFVLCETAQTTIGGSSLTGPTVVVYNATDNQNLMPTPVAINSSLNTPGGVLCLYSAAALTNTVSGIKNVVLRVTTPGTRYDNYSATVIITGFYI